MSARRLQGLIVALAGTVLLQACETTRDTSASAYQPLLAGILATEFGSGLDGNARTLAARTEYRALETGSAGAAVPWKFSDTLSGQVVPQQPYQVGSANCRRYVHTILQDGVARSVAATACRDEQGRWQPLI
ncbi:MAG: hypothetical protein WBO55_11665 [Rhizobiaceae bacterium]